MKTAKFFALVAISTIMLAIAAHAQYVNGWGSSSDATGVTIGDFGFGGDFTVSNTPTGNVDWRAAIPGGTVTLGLNQSLSFSGTMNWAYGSMGGGVFRIGILDFGSIGTLTGPPTSTWSTTSSDSGVTGYWWGLPTGGNGVSNPSGGEITRKPAGSANSWFSGTGGTAVPGTSNNNPGDLSPGTYNFNLTLTDTAGGVSISYSMVGGSYSETGTVLDTAGTVPSTFNTVGFFANPSDTALEGPGIFFSGVEVTETTVPEPSSFALTGIGFALLVKFCRRRR